VSLYTGTKGQVIRVVSADTGAVSNGAKRQRILAVSEWSPEEKEDSLTFYNMEISQEGAYASPSGFDLLRRFPLDSPSTALQVADLGGGSGLLVSGNSQGQISRIHFKLPPQTVTSAEDVKWEGLDETSSSNEPLPPWLDAHAGPVSALDINVHTKEIVSTGQDGAVFLANPTATTSADQFRAARPTASYTAVKWASQMTFVTAGTTGGLEVWDVREGGRRAASRSDLAWGHTGHSTLDARQGTGRRITCLDVHPSRPHLCATGSSAATAAVWDLRFQAAPVSRSAGPTCHGDATDIHFDSRATDSAATPAVLLTTDDGVLLGTSADLGAAQTPSRMSELIKTPDGLVSFAVDLSSGEDVFCLTDAECILYLHRPSVS